METTDVKTESVFDQAVDAAIDAAVDQAALQQEREMARAIWSLMNRRKGRRRPHRGWILQDATKLIVKRKRLQKLARRARAVTYKNR